jgi:hypothetical protein
MSRLPSVLRDARETRYQTDDAAHPFKTLCPVCIPSTIGPDVTCRAIPVAPKLEFMRATQACCIYLSFRGLVKRALF